MTGLTKHLPPRLPVARSCSRQTQGLPKTFTMVLVFYFVIPSVHWGSFRSSNPNNNECKSKRAFHQGTNPETTHLCSKGLAAHWWVPQSVYSTVLCSCDHLPGAEQKPKTWIRCRKITEPDSSPVWTGWHKKSQYLCWEFPLVESLCLSVFEIGPDTAAVDWRETNLCREEEGRPNCQIWRVIVWPWTSQTSKFLFPLS